MIGASDPAHALRGRSASSAACSRGARSDEPIDETVGDAVITALNDNDDAMQARRDAGARRDALRARRPGADRSVSVLRQGRPGRGRARRAGPHRASVERCRCSPRSWRRRTRRCKGIAIEGLGADRRSRRSSTTIQSALDGERNDAVHAGRQLRVGAARRTRPIDPIVEALTRPRLRDRRGGTWSSWRRAARRRSPAICRIPIARVRVERRRRARPERRSGGAAARRAAAADRDVAGRARRRTRASRGSTSSAKPR